MDVALLHQMLDKVIDDDDKDCFKRKIQIFTDLARKPPIHKNSEFNQFKSLIWSVATEVPVISDCILKLIRNKEGYGYVGL